MQQFRNLQSNSRCLDRGGYTRCHEFPWSHHYFTRFQLENTERRFQVKSLLKKSEESRAHWIISLSFTKEAWLVPYILTHPKKNLERAEEFSMTPEYKSLGCSRVPWTAGSVLCMFQRDAVRDTVSSGEKNTLSLKEYVVLDAEFPVVVGTLLHKNGFCSQSSLLGLAAWNK